VLVPALSIPPLLQLSQDSVFQHQHAATTPAVLMLLTTLTHSSVLHMHTRLTTFLIDNQDVDKCTLTTRDTTAVDFTDHLALSSGIIAAVLSVTSNERAIGIGESLVQVLEF
jgi:hypothetical protein